MEVVQEKHDPLLQVSGTGQPALPRSLLYLGQFLNHVSLELCGSGEMVDGELVHRHTTLEQVVYEGGLPSASISGQEYVKIIGDIEISEVRKPVQLQQ